MHAHLIDILRHTDQLDLAALVPDKLQLQQLPHAADLAQLRVNLGLLVRLLDNVLHVVHVIVQLWRTAGGEMRGQIIKNQKMAV